MTDGIKNLRITFWGTQGSLQYFPDPVQIQEYSGRIAQDALSRMCKDAAARFGDKPFTLQELLANDHTEDNVAAYLKRIGRVNQPTYGGETTCAEIETAAGDVIVIDGGSGIRHFAKRRIKLWQDRSVRTLYFLGTHDHLDHRIGLPFSAICFARPAFRLNVFGNYRVLAALDDRFAVFSRNITEATHRDDPLDYRMMPAQFIGTQIVSPDESLETSKRIPNCEVHDGSQPIIIGDTIVQPFPVYHASTPCLAYKFTHGDASFVFCTDHELRHGKATDEQQRRSEIAEARVREMCQGVDAAYFDGQYLLDEYLGKTGTGQSPGVPRIDWGHSCVEDVIERAAACEIGKTYVGHHDPDREWLDRVKLDERLAGESRRLGRHIELAKDRLVVEL